MNNIEHIKVSAAPSNDVEIARSTGKLSNANNEYHNALVEQECHRLHNMVCERANSTCQAVYKAIERDGLYRALSDVQQQLDELHIQAASANIINGYVGWDFNIPEIHHFEAQLDRLASSVIFLRLSFMARVSELGYPHDNAPHNPRE